MATLRSFKPGFARSLNSPFRHVTSKQPILFRRRAGQRAPHSTQSQTTVSRQWITRGRVLSFITYSVIFWVSCKYILGRFVDVDVEVRVGDEARSDQDDEDNDDEMVEGPISIDDDEASFISLQFPKKLPKQFYKASDPEWQEFARFSRDKKRQEAVRNDLAQNVLKSASANPRLAARLGEEIKWTKLWVDFMFPDSPPPEYTRQGILVLEDELALSTQIMPHEEFQQLTSILYPSAVYKAFKNSLNLVYMMQKIKFKQFIGQELNETERRTNLALKIAKMRLDVEDGRDASPHVTPPVADSKAEKLGPPAEAAQSPRTSQQSSLPGVADTLERAKSMMMATDATIISRLFMTSLVHNWQTAKTNLQPPGCLYLVGDVEVQGKRGRAKIHVHAAYDPKIGKIVWTRSNVVHVWNRHQAPKGGK